jgi:hypothetical protein
LFGNSYNNDACLATAILAAATKTRLQQGMQAAHRVATVSSATKIINAAIWYYCAASLYYAHLFARESWLWQVLSRFDSCFYGDALKNAK